MARLALTHDADLMVVDRRGEIAADGSIPEDLGAPARAVTVRCRTARRARRRCPSPTASPSLFAGGEHDWAAAELGAWLAPARPRGSSSIGVRGRDGGDASRLLASASIAIQQVVGIDVEPVLADAGPDGLVAAAGQPGWRRRAVAALAARGPRRVAARAAGSHSPTHPRAPRRASGGPRAARAADPVHLDDRRGRLIIAQAERAEVGEVERALRHLAADARREELRVDGAGVDRHGHCVAHERLLEPAHRPRRARARASHGRSRSASAGGRCASIRARCSGCRAASRRTAPGRGCRCDA